MRAKWLSPYRRTTSKRTDINKKVTSIAVKGLGWGSRFTDEFELQFHSNGVPCHPMKEINERDKDIKDNH